MSSSANQPVNPPPPPADAVEEEPVVEPEIDDGYEADDEGEEGWPQDPFDQDDNFSVITVEEEGDVDVA